MRFLKSIVWRITIWHSIMFIFILFLFSGFLYFTFSEMVTKEVDSILTRELGLIAYCLEEGDSYSKIEQHINRLRSFESVNQEEIYWIIETDRGQIIAESRNLDGQLINDSETLKKMDENTFSWDPELNGIPLRAMSMQLISENKLTYRITVATNDTIRHFAIDQLRNIIIISNFVFLGISIVMGWLISKKTLKPIHQIISTTNTITATSLHERLPIEGPEDELYSLSKTLNHMIDRLESSFTQIQQFTSDVSHELRTSLTIMRGELDVALNRNRSEEEYKDVLYAVLEEVIYLSDMVEKFLYLSRNTSNSNLIERKTVDGMLLFQNVRNHLLSLEMKKQIELHIQIPDPFILFGDEDLLRRLFINLIENALKYTPEGGTVEIKANRTEKFIYINVIDNGIGISEEHLPFIFQRFYRADDSRSRSQGGTGLGLSLCKWIVDVHEGTIEVRSKPNEGTCVTVKLPIY
ncbi:HAMP domain-containing protein [Bacillus sp. sid0103]|uniref:sensor histidine kinase n=1 Tax=Bacillus sp. sid0103 TaxID=2856337 RepID=UPI001C4921D5|nr:ATP-binding protein [Bacillus sp. sid0103]MBV7506208.1 HAMP domain-containing protein [Bacillus sp. sid0103]